MFHKFKKKIKNTLKSTYRSIKYPFLYPRNRWSGRHYTNWKLLEKQSELYNKYHVLEERGKEKECKKWYKDDIKDGKLFTSQYWTNWWALPCHKLLGCFHNVLSFFHCIPSYDEFYALEYGCPGWYKRFGNELLEDMRKQLKKDNMLYDLRIQQIKEKWGVLEIYVNYASKEFYELLRKYRAKSEFVCIECGKDADVITSAYSWRRPLCKECYDKLPHKCQLEAEKKDGEWKFGLDGPL